MQDNIYKVIQVKCTDIVKKYFGEGPKALSEIFRFAATEEKSIIFLDEIDSIMTARDKGSLKKKRQNKLTNVNLRGHRWPLAFL